MPRAGQDVASAARARPLAAALLVAVLVALAAAMAPVRAVADEALLPDEAAGDADDTLEPDVDPTETGVAPLGEEPVGPELTETLDAYLDDNFPESGIPGLAVAVVDADGVRYL